MRKVNLWGYTIYDNGTIIGLYGKKMKPKAQIKILWGKQKKEKIVYYARLVYYAFHYKNFDFNDKTIVVRHINGNELDFNLRNLIAIKRKYIVQGQYNGCAKLTDKEVEEIKKIYKNNKEENMNINNPITKISYRKLAKIYNVSHTLIKGIISGKYRNKENYILK